MPERRPAWRDVPLVTATPGPVRQVMAVNRAAALAGLRSGMKLASALAQVPGVKVAAHEPQADARLLAALAERCTLFSPWTAADGASGLWLDVSGCGHLFGGEAGLLERLAGRFQALGLTARAALAATPGAAWAWARFGEPAAPILSDMEQLAPLPPAALRLAPDTIQALTGLGLRRVGDLMAIPRAQLSRRFGPQVVWRLDQMRGDEPEPISPLRPPVAYRAHTTLAEPISRAEDIAATLGHLLSLLCRQLEGNGLGARRLELTLFRVDGSLARAEIGTGMPCRDPGHLARLFRDRLAEIRPDFGFEAACLEAPHTQPQPAAQDDLEQRRGEADLNRLLDSLGNRLGPGRLVRLIPRPSHVPERSVHRQSPGAPPPAGGWPAGRAPIRLLPHPEPIEAMAPIPDAPPLRFRWRGRLHLVVRADGPERIAPEWWHEEAEERDYYRIEDEQGLRLWLYRLGHYGGAEPPRWYLHGVFP